MMQQRPMLLVGLSLILFTGHSSARYILVDIGDEIGTSNLRVGEDKGISYISLYSISVEKNISIEGNLEYVTM